MDKKETKKTVRIFALGSFLNDLGADMIYPIWPLFLTSVLGADMAILGLIDGLSDSIVAISQAISGYVSDKIKKRKIFIWIGYLFGAAARLGYAISATWQQIIPFKILDRAGKIREAPRDAIIADVSTLKNRGKNFGIVRAMDNLGAVVGITISILFIETLGYRNLFLIAAIPSAIGAFLIFTLIKEKKPVESKVFKGLSFKDLNKNFILFLILSSFFALASFSYSFLLIFAKQFGFKIYFVPVLYLIFTVAASIFALPFGKLADKMGRKPVIMLAYLFWGLVCLSFIFIQTYWAIVIAFILYGMHKGALEPVQKAFVSELAPKEYRASSLGGFQMVIGLCALPASLIAGLLWDKIGVFMPFYFSLGLTIISIVMLIFVKEK